MSVPVTANLTVALTDDASMPARDEVLRHMTDPDGLYGMPREVAEEFLVYGGVEEIGSPLAPTATPGRPASS